VAGVERPAITIDELQVACTCGWQDEALSSSSAKIAADIHNDLRHGGEATTETVS
jgi:hypothetical protein